MLRRVCIVQVGRIGDMLLVTPMFRALKEADPAVEVYVLAGRRNQVVVRGHPLVDRVHVYTKRPAGALGLAGALRLTRFDAWIDPKDHPSSESRVFAWLARAPIKIGYGGRWPFTHPACEERAGGEQAALRSLRNLAILGVESSDPRPVLPPTPVEDAALDRFLRAHDIAAYAAVNISAGRPERCWPVERWTALVSALAGAIPRFLVLSDPKDGELAEALARRAPGCLVFPTPSVAGTFRVVRRARLVVTLDTCTVHVASGFDTPVVALYANLPSNYRRFRPLGARSRSVMPARAGAPLADIEVEQVVGACRSLLSEAGTC
jgi:ADP-heptose:LPS heptosyltransferase